MWQCPICLTRTNEPPQIYDAMVERLRLETQKMYNEQHAATNLRHVDEIERLDDALDSSVSISHDMAVTLERAEAVIEAARQACRHVGGEGKGPLFAALAAYDSEDCVVDGG